MTQLLKCNAEGQALINEIANAGKGLAKTTSIGVARGIAYYIPVDTAIRDVSEFPYLTRHVNAKIECFVSAVNELVVLDIPTIIQLALAFYMFRMEHYLGTPSTAMSAGKGVTDFFKINRYFDEMTLGAIEANPLEITRIANGVAAILPSLCPEGA